MHTAILKRIESSTKHTLGMLFAGGRSFYTIEPPWLYNAFRISCIPTGKYICIRRKSPRFGWRYWLQDTDPRTYVMIHPGNIAKHTQGCILLGARKGWLGGRRAVLMSRYAVREFEEHLGRRPFELEII